MIRAVLDANVFASGVLRYDEPTSTPGAILRAWAARSFELVTSDALIAEIERTLTQPYFTARISGDLRDALVTALHEDATRTVLSATVTGVATHPEDDLVIAASLSAGVDVLVTGDRQLQKIGSYQGVTIISPRDFLASLEGHIPGGN